MRYRRLIQTQFNTTDLIYFAHLQFQPTSAPGLSINQPPNTIYCTRLIFHCTHISYLHMNNNKNSLSFSTQGCRRHQNWHEKGCSTCQITSTLHVCPTVDCALLPLTSILWTRKTGQFFRCSKYRITLNSIRFVAMGKRTVLGCFRRFHFVSCHRIYEWKRCFRAFEGCQCRSISWSYDPGI